MADRYFIDTTGNNKFDTEVLMSGGYVVSWTRDEAGNVTKEVKHYKLGDFADANDPIVVANSLRKAAQQESERIGRAWGLESEGARLGGDTIKTHEEGDDYTGWGGEETDWGAGTVTADDFIDEYGNPRDKNAIYTNLKSKFPGMGEAELKDQISDLLPKYQGVAAGDVDIAKGQLEEDIYGISKAVEDVAPTAPGTGVGMRAGIGMKEKVSEKFDVAQRGYGETIYGLEEKAKEGFEKDVEGWIGRLPGDPFATASAKMGGYVFRDRSGIGGNTRSKKTFLDILSELPEAGGS